MTTLQIFWKDDEFRPTVFACNVHAAFKLWLELRTNERVHKIECRNTDGHLMPFNKGWKEFASQSGQQYTI